MTRSARLLFLVMFAAALGGCASMSSRVAATNDAAAQDLDSLTYARAAENAKLKIPSNLNSSNTAATSAQARALVVPPPVIAPPVLGPAPATVQVVAVPVDPAAAFEGEPPYRLDSGDRLRIVVFGQEGLSNLYLVDASGNVTLPLIKTVAARGLTTVELARTITEQLRNGFIREPHVAIEVEVYRPFFILGEVTQPGQYAYVPHMTVENAIAIAGGFTPRAYRWDIKLDRPVPGGVDRNKVPLHTRMRPGDTIIVQERWF